MHLRYEASNIRFWFTALKQTSCPALTLCYCDSRGPWLVSLVVSLNKHLAGREIIHDRCAIEHLLPAAISWLTCAHTRRLSVLNGRYFAGYRDNIFRKQLHMAGACAPKVFSDYQSLIEANGLRSPPSFTRLQLFVYNGCRESVEVIWVDFKVWRHYLLGPVGQKRFQKHVCCELSWRPSNLFFLP